MLAQTANRVVLVVAGEPREEKRQQLRLALRATEVIWPDSFRAKRAEDLAGFIRKADIVLIVPRWLQHASTPGKRIADIAKAAGKTVVWLNRGLGINTIAQAIIEQLSEDYETMSDGYRPTYGQMLEWFRAASPNPGSELAKSVLEKILDRKLNIIKQPMSRQFASEIADELNCSAGFVKQVKSSVRKGAQLAGVDTSFAETYYNDEGPVQSNGQAAAPELVAKELEEDVEAIAQRLEERERVAEELAKDSPEVRELKELMQVASDRELEATQRAEKLEAELQALKAQLSHSVDDARRAKELESELSVASKELNDIKAKLVVAQEDLDALKLQASQDVAQVKGEFADEVLDLARAGCVKPEFWKEHSIDVRRDLLHRAIKVLDALS